MALCGLTFFLPALRGMAREGWIRYTQLDAWGVSLLFVYRILNAMCVQV